MKLIDLSGITASKGYPGLANNPNVMVGLDFLQSAALDNAARLAIAIANQNFNGPIILNGCILSGNTISAGSMYWNGEIFIWNSPSSGLITGSPNTYIACSWVADPTDTSPYQTTLSDASQVSIHNQRTLRFAYASSPNTGNIPDFGEWLPTQIAINASNIAALQSAVLTPYNASDRVGSIAIPTSETVIHSLVVSKNVNNMLIAYSGDFSNTSSQSDVQIKIYVGGTVSGHSPGISGTISGGSLIKTAACGTDNIYNNNAGIGATILSNVSAGQAVTVTIFAGSSGPYVQTNSDLIITGGYSN